MHEVPSSIYDEAQLTLLLRAVSPDGTYPRLAADLALVLRHTGPQTVPATLVPELARAVLASVDPQRAVNHCTLVWLPGIIQCTIALFSPVHKSRL